MHMYLGFFHQRVGRLAGLGRTMQPAEDPLLLAATRVRLATTHSLGGFFRIYVIALEIQQHTSHSLTQK